MNGSLAVTGRRVVVVGAARSGVAAAELLTSRGARVVLTDLRHEIDDADRLRRAGVAVELGGHRRETFLQADLVVLSPGVPPRQPDVDAARRAGIPVIGEIELASRWLRGRIVAVTGTKGKSTTSTLTGRILQAGGLAATVGGNIGLALSAQVDQSTPDTIHVVEVSSFQLEATETFRPWIAVFLNFSPDHLDRHATVEEYREAKAKVFANQMEDDWAVVNADDPAVLEIARRGRARLLPFAPVNPIAEGVAIAGSAIVRRHAGRDEALVPLDAIRLTGRHLVADVMAAAAVGSLVGVSPAAMTRAVSSFRGLAHAFELVDEVAGVRFINDSKATNVEAARRAIESVDTGLVAILGGRYKGGDLRILREALAARATAVVAIGEARALVVEAVGDVVPVHEAASMDAAVALAATLAPVPGTVLLAPACASFDMFRDYAARGTAFTEAVRRVRATRRS
jgi:UDP-N-acetylmuramoylalanine--D-glutamate ligase